ncbi:protein-glutamine gamma-glutamyltransferase [Paenibacillaceae bacterium WGS1546]|uniref:protein-glutamine gamma-glutamyltransferase n=1 Tax=Cohnella sp. WGS1546 TaxID=3366810 RepID=UPI00372D7B04
MIQIPGYDLNAFDASSLTELERAILRQKMQSPATYRYDSPGALLFELNMRSRIVAAARALNASGASFTTFDRSYANERYWTLDERGGFRQNPGVSPSEALNDIYVNGRLYGFECATAMVIILYKAVLDMIGRNAFHAYFNNLLLYDWHYDNDLQLQTVNDFREAYPGDVLYFRNPDHDPDKPEWQGENVIKLGNDLYFGHGIGIGSAADMIAALNRARRPGSTTSAYLTDQANYPDFGYLYRLAQPFAARIGSRSYRYIFV